MDIDGQRQGYKLSLACDLQSLAGAHLSAWSRLNVIDPPALPFQQAIVGEELVAIWVRFAVLLHPGDPVSNFFGLHFYQ